MLARVEQLCTQPNPDWGVVISVAKRSLISGKDQKTKTGNGCCKCGDMNHIKKFRPQLQHEKDAKQDAKANVVVGLLASEDRDNHGKWFVDSGASQHMCCSKKYFTTFQEF